MTATIDLRVSRKSVQQETVEKLRGAILSGVFTPGIRLVEADLCNSLGVSRPLLREALRSLQAERLIDIVPNRGPQVPRLSWGKRRKSTRCENFSRVRPRRVAPP